jgi:serine/threonine protein kinase
MRFFVGALESAERGALDGHLAQCDRCAQLVAEAARTTGAGSAELSDRMRPAVLSPGMLIANRYHVRRLLGVGAMGEVHEVEDTLLGTIVALKTLNARLAGDLSALKRLKREVAAARSVTHPNACRIFDLGSHSGHEVLGVVAFLTMEYLPGVTLAKYLTAHGPYAPREALPLLIQLADGLAAAHAAGIVHRDLKAENIMMVEAKSGFRAVIMDFGLAGFDLPDDAGLEHGSGFSGTVAYAAPERIAGGRATPASDVYSFGLIAHEMLTGQRPIPGGSQSKLAGCGTLPASWERLLRRAIDVDPKARFANGGAFAEGLRALAVGAKSGAPSGRRPFVFSTVVVAVVVAAVASWTARGRDERSALMTAARALPLPHSAPAPAAPQPLTASVATPTALAAGGPLPLPPRPSRSPARRVAAASSPRSSSPPTPAVLPTATTAAPLQATEEDLVRDVHFQKTRPSPVTGDAELVDPFARRRLRADSTGSAP